MNDYAMVNDICLSLVRFGKDPLKTYISDCDPSKLYYCDFLPRSKTNNWFASFGSDLLLGVF
jgi:hypothetical protein